MTASFDAEDALVGVLLHLPAPVVVEALTIVRAEDFGDLRLGLVADVCRELAGRGVDPCPTAVLVHVRAHALVTGADAVQALSMLLINLFEAAPTPAGWRYYLLGVLDEALRRRCAMATTRIEQAVEGESLGSLVALVAGEADAVRELAARRDAVAGDHPARLRAVTA